MGISEEEVPSFRAGLDSQIGVRLDRCEAKELPDRRAEPFCKRDFT
jgi:hypothetical protein